jgi:uncharacterized membrane protein
VTFKEMLQGKWLGHPLHPALVHLPTGLWPAALFFDIMSRVAGDNAAVRTSFYCIALGLLATLLAIPTGLADFAEIKRGKPAWKLAIIHMSINAVVFALMLLNAISRWRGGLNLHYVSPTQFVLSFIAVTLLAISGYLGGRMVFDYGVSIARMSKKKWRRIAEAGQANLPPE